MNNNNNGSVAFFALVFSLMTLSFFVIKESISYTKIRSVNNQDVLFLGNNYVADLNDVPFCDDSIEEASRLYKDKKISDVETFLSDNYSLICSDNGAE